MPADFSISRRPERHIARCGYVLEQDCPYQMGVVEPLNSPKAVDRVLKAP